MKRAVVLLILTLFSSAHLCLLAQDEESIVPAEIKRRTVVNEVLSLPKGYFAVGGSLVLQSLNKTFDESGDKILDPANQTLNGLFSLMAITYGITDRIETEIYLNSVSQRLRSTQLIEYPGANYSERVLSEASYKGIGDMEIRLAYQLIPADVFGSGLKVTAALGIPTGDADYSNLNQSTNSFSYDAPTGFGEFSLTPIVRYRKVFFPFSAEIYLQYRIPFGGNKVYAVTGTNAILTSFDFIGRKVFSATASFNFQLNDWMAFRHGLFYQNSKQEEVEGYDPPLGDSQLLQYFPYLSFQLGQFRIEQGMNIPLGLKNAPANLGYLILTKYIF